MTPILRKYRWHELLSGVGSTGQDIKTLTSLFLFLLRATISPDAQYPVTIDRIGVLVVVERVVIGVDHKVMVNDTWNYDAVGKRRVVCDPQA